MKTKMYFLYGWPFLKFRFQCAFLFPAVVREINTIYRCLKTGNMKRII